MLLLLSGADPEAIDRSGESFSHAMARVYDFLPENPLCDWGPLKYLGGLALNPAEIGGRKNFWHAVKIYKNRMAERNEYTGQEESDVLSQDKIDALLMGINET